MSYPGKNHRLVIDLKRETRIEARPPRTLLGPKEGRKRRAVKGRKGKVPTNRDGVPIYRLTQRYRNRN